MSTRGRRSSGARRSVVEPQAALAAVLDCLLGPPGEGGANLTGVLSARTKIFLYVKILSTFTDSQPSLFTTLINKKDMLTGAIYSKFKPRNSQLAP